MDGWLDGRGGNAERQTRWLTPPLIPEALGHFDLDPCGAPGHDLAARTYLLENDEDGLALPWVGRVWMNPPYGREAEPFLKKLGEHGHGTALIFASPETRVWRELVWPVAAGILFIDGRVTFWTEDRVPARTNPGKGSALIAYGDPDVRALRASGIPGQLVEPAWTVRQGGDTPDLAGWLRARS